MAKITALAALAFSSSFMVAAGSLKVGSSWLNRDDCLWNCPTTEQYNPVCGSNGVKYWNEGYLACARYCGTDVYAIGPPPCSSQIETTTRDDSNEMERCIWECPRTHEYNPVCGSDLKKYENMGHLLCAQSCGVDVTFTHPAPCNVIN